MGGDTDAPKECINNHINAPTRVLKILQKIWLAMLRPLRGFWANRLIFSRGETQANHRPDTKFEVLGVYWSKHIGQSMHTKTHSTFDGYVNITT